MPDDRPSSYRRRLPLACVYGLAGWLSLTAPAVLRDGWPSAVGMWLIEGDWRPPPAYLAAASSERDRRDFDFRRRHRVAIFQEIRNHRFTQASGLPVYRHQQNDGTSRRVHELLTAV